MPRYEIVGVGRETGRKRTHVFTAKNQEDAIMMASSEGTIVDTGKTVQLPEPPPEPATERQVSYAKSLGVNFHDDISKDDMSILIAEAVEKRDAGDTTRIEKNNAEKQLFSAHPAMFRNRPILFCLFLALIFVYGIGLVLLVVWWIKCRTHTLIITNQRITVKHGILSKSTTEIRHCDVRNIQVQQSFFQRVLRTGSIAISSAGTGSIEIIVNGMPSPQKIAELIRQYQ